jgi:hypothetical protein
MDMRIDQAGQEEAVPPIGDGRARIRGANRLEVSASGNLAVADQQSSIRMELQRAILQERIAGRVK